MIVPEYWSEAKEKIQVNGRSRTLWRFGWSDASERDALESARNRVREAAQRALSGEKIRTRDPKVAYNGADGLPIREEIIERHGDAVITRNSYGALCLNTPDVLFADIDVPEPRSGTIGTVVFILCLAVGYWYHIQLDAWWPLVAAGILGAIMAIAGSVSRSVRQAFAVFRKDPFELALARVQAFSENNPDWAMRVYRTPNGYRVLVMHSTFDPNEEQAFDFMAALKCDPLYMRMCKNQKCFRARVSPKPWRIGMEHIRPRPGVWPIKREHMERRRRWVSEYKQKGAAFSSCRFELALGSGRPSRSCEHVRAIHDRLSKVDSALPIA